MTYGICLRLERPALHSINHRPEVSGRPIPVQVRQLVITNRPVVAFDVRVLLLLAGLDEVDIMPRRLAHAASAALTYSGRCHNEFDSACCAIR